MQFAEFLKGLDESARADYARRAGTTPGYIRVHLLSGRKVPRRDLLEALVVASDGQVSRTEMLDHFFPPAPQGAEEASA